MDEKKQIDYKEFARQMRQVATVFNGTEPAVVCSKELWEYIASMVESFAGYRKQSEGEWIDKPTGAYSRMQSWCSACGKHSGIGGIESNRHKPYCPNCGAKMKGGEGK